MIIQIKILTFSGAWILQIQRRAFELEDGAWFADVSNQEYAATAE